MCGVVGFWLGRALSQAPLEVLGRMTKAVSHRGPDDAGLWFDSTTGVGLGHRRLSVIDLSPLGHQPMESASGRCIISFNGEIYNHGTLRAGLEARGIGFRGYSDTEVLVTLIEQEGVAQALRQAVGMFALAVWDRESRILSLARDRFGEKPLYYGQVSGGLAFGSELKAIRAHPGWAGLIDRAALTLFMRHNYVPAPHSIYEGIRKVEPGTIVSFAGPTHTTPTIVKYWSARVAAEAGFANQARLGATEAVDELDHLLRESVRGQMISDVPLGAFLSGGIDSSLIVALMQAESGRPVQTFTIGFREATYNEAPFARVVAERLGTAHTELYVTPTEALAVVPKLPTLYDEPFADSSQVPTFLVAQMARSHVTVSLSGDGGDELFGGYWRYFLGARLWQRIRSIPQVARRVASAGLRWLSPRVWDGVLGPAFRIAPKRFRVSFPGDRIHKLAGILASPTAEQLYHDLNSHWRSPAVVVVGGLEPPTVFTDPTQLAAVDGMVPRMMYLDSVSYLPDDLLVKVDRASMGVGLETRSPYLDHRLYEFAWTLPLEYKVRDGTGKWLLRQLLSRYLPPSLFERPKMGFGVPLEHWLRGPLRDWANDLLAPDRLRREGYLRPEPIQALWREHLSGRRNWQYLLWDALMFEAWLGEQAG